MPASPIFIPIAPSRAGLECLINSDCYASDNEDVTCQNVTIGMNLDTNRTLYGFRCTKQETSSSASVAGFISVLLASIFWGSNFIPARQAKAGNGILFQFFMTSGIATVGFLVQVIRATNDGGFTFYPSAVIGGMLWCIGNTVCIPTISLLGLGLGVALWCSGNLLFGFITSSVGFWGVQKPDLPRPYLSYIAIVFGVISFVFLAFVRPTRHDKKENSSSAGEEEDKNVNEKLAQVNTIISSTTTNQKYGSRDNGNDDSNGKKDQQLLANDDEPAAVTTSDEFPIIGLVGGLKNARLLGIGLALGCSCLFGINNIPVASLMDNYKTNSRIYIAKSAPNGLDYVFSHFFGTFVTSLVIALLLGVYEKCRVWYPDSKIGRLPALFGKVDEPMSLIWPGFLCGVGWAAAQSCSFYGETKLGMAIAYPMVTLGPSLVSVLWSLLYFRELEGRRNLMLLIGAFVAAGVCVALVVASRSN